MLLIPSKNVSDIPTLLGDVGAKRRRMERATINFQ
jgi:hypothetical protein